MGGLGNQMFQFAAAKNVAKLLNEDWLANTSNVLFPVLRTVIV